MTFTYEAAGFIVVLAKDPGAVVRVLPSAPISGDALLRVAVGAIVNHGGSTTHFALAKGLAAVLAVTPEER